LLSVYFLFFDSYAKSLFDSVIGTFLRDFLGKLLNLVLILFYIFNLINFEYFVFGYVFIYILPTPILIIVLSVRKQMKISRFNSLLMKQYRSEIFKVSAFGIMAGFSGVAVVNIDTMMTNYFLGLSLSGIYAIMFFFGSLVLMPSKSLRKISSIVLAEAWKKNDLETVSDIYFKSTINQLVIGIFLSGGIFINLDNVFIMIPQYSSGKLALTILMIGFLAEMVTGLSAIIFTGSKYYKQFSIQIFSSLLVIVVLCIIFIPVFGINGTAIASSLTLIIFAILRFTFLYKKFKLQPYNIKHIKIFAFGIFALIINNFIPYLGNYFVDFIVRSSIFSLLFMTPVIISKTADDINNIIRKILIRFNINL